MNIVTSTSEYERWLSKQTKVVPSALQKKHEDMADNIFSFLRATYYRWAQRFPVVCKDLAELESILSVGDLHIENFGTWLDAWARLVWGINDFDEAYFVAWTNDLVRLATSVRMAAATGHIAISQKLACQAILEGYRKGLENGARPFVLEHKHAKLNRMAHGEVRSPILFWRKMLALPSVKDVPASAKRLLADELPKGATFTLHSRVAGEGSLGRPRFVALTPWKGGYLAREAKAAIPSASVWSGGEHGEQLFYNDIVEKAARAADPYLKVEDGWVVRRLSPMCSRIELSQVSAIDAYTLLKAMGRETANVDVPDAATAKKVLKQLDMLPSNWLVKASAAMAADVAADYKDWQQHMRAKR